MTQRALIDDTQIADAAWMVGLRIPASWTKSRVKHLVQSMRAGDAITVDAIEDTGDYPVYGANGLRGFTSRRTHRGTHVLIGRQGALCGNVHLVSGEFWASEHAIVATPSGDVDERWLAALLRVMNLGQYSTNAAQPGIGVGQIAPLHVYVPPLDEQRAIADYLDHETARIDVLVAKQEEFKAKLTERRISLISDSVIRGLNPETPLKPSGADWFDNVPSHWRVERLKNSILDARTGLWGSDPVGDKTDLRCVRVADFDRHRLRVGNAETMRAVSAKDASPRLLRRGDLLLEKSGGTPLNPVGFVAMYEDDEGPAVTSNFIARLRLQDGQHPRYWLYAHAASYGTRLTARSVKQTTGIQNLDQASYFNELFPYPPLEEQSAIAAHIDEQTTRIDTLIAKAEEHIALAKERRSALITAAVTGQLDVRTATRKAS